MSYQKASKKLVNSTKNIVCEALEGFVLTHSNVKLLKGQNVIVRSDLDSFKDEGKVALITGGGSGHEPAHIGYIGKGMLTAAVCGDVFTSPSSSSILTTIRRCATDIGVLLIVKNYTGDRLNFGKALEVASAEGIKVAMVIVNEDCALTSSDKSTGRRGLCGTVFIHKIAGAMAEEGRTLSDIKTYIETSVKLMGTISVSLSSCSIPGKPASFTIPDNMLEFGLGIHGEAGVRQIELKSAKEVIDVMMDHLVTSPFMPDIKGQNVAVIVNNLGGTTNIELSITAKEVLCYLNQRNVSVERCYVGTYVTSLEMAGVSISVLLLQQGDGVCYLDKPCATAAWKHDGQVASLSNQVIPSPSITKNISDFDVTPVGNGIHLHKCTREVCLKIVENTEILNELDRHTGDGDTGSTLSRGANAVLEKLSDDRHLKLPVNSPRSYFLEISKLIESVMGGSSGALLSVLLTTFASKYIEEGEGHSAQNYIQAFQAGVDALKKYGGAEEGDKTMLDAFYPCLRSLQDSLKEKPVNIIKMMDKAAKVTRSAAEATKHLKAKSGRASYVSNVDKSRPDPGAIAVALLVETIANYFEKS